MVNLPWKGVWYISGGKSNIAQLIKDAGGDYLWKNDNSSHNLTSYLEAVFQKAYNADIWINPGQAKSKNDIIASDERLIRLKAMRKDKIYNRDARLNKFGGNDYMESGNVNPDLILKDLIYIFNPKILPEHKLYYYRKTE